MLASLVSLGSELKVSGKFHSSNLRADFIQFCWVGPKHDNLIKRSRPPCMLMLTSKCLFQISSGTKGKFFYQSHVRLVTYYAKVAKWKKQAACLVSNTDSSHILVGSPEHVKKFREVKSKPVAVPKLSCLIWNEKLSHLSCRGLPSSFGLSICLICFFIFSISFPTFFFRVSNTKVLAFHADITSYTMPSAFLLTFERGHWGFDALQ